MRKFIAVVVLVFFAVVGYRYLASSKIGATVTTDGYAATVQAGIVADKETQVELTLDGYIPAVVNHHYIYLRGIGDDGLEYTRVVEVSPIEYDMLMIGDSYKLKE